MKFIISNAELSKLLTKLQNIVAQKATIPILSNILIEATNDELVITATDLTVGMRCYSEAKIMEEGATTLPAKKFGQLIKELTSPHIELISNPQEITDIIANSSHFKLHGMSKKEFPALPDLSGAIQFKVAQKDLKRVLFSTAFAVSREDTRYVLTGVFMQIGNSTATFVGTDGKRLARSQLPIEIDPQTKGGYIIPLKAVEEMLKNLGEEGEATVYLMQDKVAVEANKSMIISKLLTGEYPDVNRVIPESVQFQVTLHREELITLLRQVSLFTSDSNQAVRFTFTEGELRLSAMASEIGEGKVSMPVNYTGSKFDIAFNPEFFMAILRHCNEESVTLGLTDSYNPGIITESNSPDEPFFKKSPLFVIMPLRLTEET